MYVDENSCADEDDDFLIDGDDLRWGAVGRNGSVVGTCDPDYVTMASKMVMDGSRSSSSKVDKGKGNASSSAPKASLRIMALDDDDEMWEDIGVDDDYVGDDDEYGHNLRFEGPCLRLA